MVNRIYITEIAFDRVTRQEALKKILAFLKTNKQHFVTTPNPEFLVEANKNAEFKKVLQSADLSVPDGIGILWAATFLKVKSEKLKVKNLWNVVKTLSWALFSPKRIRKVLPERVCGSDLFLDLCREFEGKIFLLGASEGIAKKTAKILKQRFPQIKIVGTFAGSPKKEEEQMITEKIQHSEAELLFVAYGSPKQELWIKRNLKKMPKVKVAMGIGGSFDFVAGRQKRAPKIMQKLGLEWLWRLIREPKRWKRIWNATVVFIRIIVK